MARGYTGVVSSSTASHPRGRCTRAERRMPTQRDFSTVGEMDTATRTPPPASASPASAPLPQRGGSPFPPRRRGRVALLLTTLAYLAGLAALTLSPQPTDAAFTGA